MPVSSDVTDSELRLTDPDFRRGAACEIEIDGRRVRAYLGETVAGVLLASGIRAFRTTRRRAEPRGYFCGIGICHDCMLTIDDRTNVRACVTPVTPGLRIGTRGFTASPRSDP